MFIRCLCAAAVYRRISFSVILYAMSVVLRGILPSCYLFTKLSLFESFASFSKVIDFSGFWFWSEMNALPILFWLELIFRWPEFMILLISLNWNKLNKLEKKNYRSLRELDIPHFHHEVVYETIVLAMEQRVSEFEKYAQRMIDLLQFLGKVCSASICLFNLARSKDFIGESRNIIPPWDVVPHGCAWLFILCWILYAVLRSGILNRLPFVASNFRIFWSYHCLISKVNFDFMYYR